MTMSCRESGLRLVEKWLMSLALTGFVTVFFTLTLLVALLEILPRLLPGAIPGVGAGAERRPTILAAPAADAATAEELVAAIGVALHRRRNN